MTRLIKRKPIRGKGNSMTLLKFFISSFVFVLIFAVLAHAQREKTQPIPPSKIATINTEVFEDETNGIKELTEAYDKLETEFKLQIEELNSLTQRIVEIQEEINKYYRMYEPPRDVFKVVEEKEKEYESLIEKYKTRQPEIKALYEKRYAETVGILNKKIARAANFFAKEKGYYMILSISKSNESFILVKSDNLDVTAEFIKFYSEDFSKKEK
jgi:Skp family chaperone for outer membrane proteins